MKERGSGDAHERAIRKAKETVRRQQAIVEKKLREQQERVEEKVRERHARAEAKVRGRNERVVDKVRERHDRVEAKVRARQDHIDERIGRMQERVQRHHERGARHHTPRRGSLTLEEILTAATRLADASGTVELSMRNVAAELGAGTMTLYWHVDSKAALLGLMVDDILGEVQPEGVPSGDWRRDLHRLAEELRRVLRSHPWAIPLAGDQYVDLHENSVRLAELLLSVLDGTGADLETVGAALHAISDYIAGALLRERAEERSQTESGMTPAEWRASVAPFVREAISSGNYPHFGRFVVEGPNTFEADERFEIGLDFLLDGLAARIGEAGD